MKRRSVLFTAAVAAVCLLCLFLPSAVAAVQDLTLRGSSRNVSDDEVTLTLFRELSFVEKLRLAGSRDATVMKVEDPASLGDIPCIPEDLAVECAVGYANDLAKYGSAWEPEPSLELWMTADTVVPIWRVKVKMDTPMKDAYGISWVETLVDGGMGGLLAVDFLFYWDEETRQEYIDRFGPEGRYPRDYVGEFDDRGLPEAFVMDETFEDRINRFFASCGLEWSASRNGWNTVTAHAQDADGNNCDVEFYMRQLGAAYDELIVNMPE